MRAIDEVEPGAFGLDLALGEVRSLITNLKQLETMIAEKQSAESAVQSRAAQIIESVICNLEIVPDIVARVNTEEFNGRNDLVMFKKRLCRARTAANKSISTVITRLEAS